MTARHPEWMEVRVDMLALAARGAPTLRGTTLPLTALDELFHAVTNAPGCCDVSALVGE